MSISRDEDAVVTAKHFVNRFQSMSSAFHLVRAPLCAPYTDLHRVPAYGL